MSVKVRFAPSPTGKLHIGGARTALFNYLFARKNKGKFFLRIEDTDRERFVKGATRRIIEALDWLGLGFDNKIVVQSERLPIYQKAAEDLVKKGLAYWCFCSKERLEKLREQQEIKKEPPKYDGKCRNLSLAEAKKRIEKGEKYVIRLKVPKKGSIEFNDLIKGKIKFDLKEIDDSVILKSDGFPTYYLASVVDDHEMDITHIIRGEEWLSSTPKNILIFKAFGWKIPQLAHIPLILATDRTKLSKRHGAVSILEYRKLGYLKEALINFIIFLGWNPKTTREIFSLDDLVKEYSLEGMGKSAAIFNIEKLNWYQQYYLKEKAQKNPKELIEEFKKISKVKVSDEDLAKILKVYVVNGRITFLKEILGNKYLFSKPKYSPKLLVFKKSDKEKTLNGLEQGARSLKQIKEKDWNIDYLHKALSSIAQSSKLSFGDVFWPIRVALSGAKATPSPEELMWILGKGESLKRIKRAISLLK